MRLFGHGYDATAAAGAGQSPGGAVLLPAARRLAPAVLAAVLYAGCGDPVGDQRDDFQADPAPVLGRWVEREPTDTPPREAFIEAGEGFLAGQFEFERTGLGFNLPFADGDWDGERITFTTGDVFGSGAESVSWTALLIPGDGGAPTVLRLFPFVHGGVPFSVEYVRP